MIMGKMYVFTLRKPAVKTLECFLKEFKATCKTSGESEIKQKQKQKLLRLRSVHLGMVQETRGAFFWGYSSYSYAGLGITEYTEFQFRIPKKKETKYQLRNKTAHRPEIKTDRFKNVFVNRLIFRYNF